MFNFEFSKVGFSFSLFSFSSYSSAIPLRSPILFTIYMTTIENRESTMNIVPLNKNILYKNTYKRIIYACASYSSLLIAYRPGWLPYIETQMLSDGKNLLKFKFN